jgi:hypothetical protein
MGHNFWFGGIILMTDLMRNYISLGCDDDGNRIRSLESVTILSDKDRRRTETSPGLCFSVTSMETRALTMTYALVSTLECQVKSLFLTMLHLPIMMTGDDQQRHQAFCDNGSVQQTYYQVSVGILKDQMHASIALFHMEIGDLIANNDKITVFPGEVESLSPGQTQQCYHMENLVHKELLEAMGTGLNGYIACLANVTDRMDDKCFPDHGISRKEINTIYEITLPELTDAAVFMKRECKDGCYIVADF